MKHNIYHGRFLTKEGILVPIDKAEDIKFKTFKKNLEEGQVLEVFMETEMDNGTVPQLAKIHACIRELAKETGYSFEDMKLEVKRQAGLCIKKEMSGELFLVCKSFGRCSKDELALTIEAIIQIGDTVGINFR